jgi:hypothetical protein
LLEIEAPDHTEDKAMTKAIYRYRFEPDVPLDEVEDTLVLALLAVEALHGEAQVHLDAGHVFDREQRACVLDATTAVGSNLNRLFVGLLRRELGEAAFRVERVAGEPTLPKA